MFIGSFQTVYFITGFVNFTDLVTNAVYSHLLSLAVYCVFLWFEIRICLAVYYLTSLCSIFICHVSLCQLSLARTNYVVITTQFCRIISA